MIGIFCLPLSIFGIYDYVMNETYYYRVIAGIVGGFLTSAIFGYYVVIDINDIDRKVAFPLDFADLELRSWAVRWKILDSSPFPASLLALVLLRCAITGEVPFVDLAGIAYNRELTEYYSMDTERMLTLFGSLFIDAAFVWILNSLPLRLHVENYKRVYSEKTRVGLNVIREKVTELEPVIYGRRKFGSIAQKRLGILHDQIMVTKMDSDQVSRIISPTGRRSASAKVILFAFVSMFF